MQGRQSATSGLKCDGDLFDQSTRGREDTSTGAKVWSRLREVSDRLDGVSEPLVPPGGGVVIIVFNRH